MVHSKLLLPTTIAYVASLLEGMTSSPRTISACLSSLRRPRNSHIVLVPPQAMHRIARLQVYCCLEFCYRVIPTKQLLMAGMRPP